MGISGLLPFVKKACRKGNLLEFNGKSIAVDVSYLLHRGIFGCAGDLAKGKDTDFYVYYVRKHVDILLRLDCHVILVFDGRPLPAKKDINDARRSRREKSHRLGEKLLKEGLTNEAHRAFQQGTTVTREIVEKTIRAFRKMNQIDIIVAPYEADAQIAYLIQNNFAYVALTEDSDLIVFGCERIIFKMDVSGSCMIYEKSKLSACVCPAIEKRFEFETFRRICILAGCDYLQGGLQGVGLKKAELFFAKTSQSDLRVILPKLPFYLNMSSVKVDKDFVEEFIKAENTFLHQIVFDPITQKHISLNPLPSYEDEENNDNEQKNKFWYAGEMSSPIEALRLALGNNDLSCAPVQDEFVLSSTIPEWSIWGGEKYLKFLGDEVVKKQNEVHKKFGAFAPKNSPIKKRKISDTSHIRSLSPSGIPTPSTNLKRRRIPLIDLEDDDHDQNEEVYDDNSLLTFRTQKQRSSDPIRVGVHGSSVVKISSHTTPSYRNGSALRWNCSEWMRIYGDESPENDETPTANNFCNESNEGKENAVSRLTLPHEQKNNDTSEVFNAESVDKLTQNIVNIDAEVISVSVEMSSPNILNPFRSQPKMVSEKQLLSGCKIGGLRRIRRPLVDVLSQSSAEQSSGGEGSCASSQKSASSSDVPSHLVSPGSPSVSTEDVFYRRSRSTSSQFSLPPSPLLSAGALIRKSINNNDQCSLENEDDVKENLNVDGSAPKSSTDETKDSPMQSPKVSPYFINNKLSSSKIAAASGYRPSGLRRRTTITVAAFPRVL